MIRCTLATYMGVGPIVLYGGCGVLERMGQYGTHHS